MNSVGCESELLIWALYSSKETTYSHRSLGKFYTTGKATAQEDPRQEKVSNSIYKLRWAAGRGKKLNLKQRECRGWRKGKEGRRKAQGGG